MGVAPGAAFPAGQVAAIKLGTTVATNALLERKGAKTLFVTTRGFADALGRRDIDGAVGEVLDLEAQITEWSTDIPFGDAMDRARASLRSLVVELGRAGEAGVRDPREVVGPFVEAMLDLRARARADRRFEEADWIRQRLEELGVEVRDTAEGSDWLLST